MKRLKKYWFIMFLMISFTFVSCKKDNNISLPTAKTYAPLFIASYTVTVGFEVVSDGGSPIIDCGIFMSASVNPETSGTRLQIAKDTGLFVVQINNLTPNTQYYIKAYAINAKGESRGDQVNFASPGTAMDYDNNVYETTKIGNQQWMAKNLKTTHFLNGDLISTTTPATFDISGESSPKYQWAYGGDDANTSAYGRLYTFYTITDTRKVCPAGWHIPTDTDWTTLESALGGFTIAGSSLKETGNSHWVSPYNLDATNMACFKALPGGYRNEIGGFSFTGNYGFWWSSTEGDISYAWVRSLSVQSSQITRSSFYKKSGLSVRCIKD
jgi:uncharacterized protein (TIGR02145 family)